jgi:trimeric autotransporter adhesin
MSGLDEPIFQNGKKLNMKLNLVAVSIFVFVFISGCGGGGSGSSNNSIDYSSRTPAQVAAITPSEIATIGGAQILALGTNIQYLTDAALMALTHYGSGAVGYHVQAISAAQIAVLTPAQVRMIGAAGPGGSVTTSQINFLNTGAWAALVSDPNQVSQITAAEMQTLFGGSQIPAFGTNIQYLSDAALNAMRYTGISASGAGFDIQNITVAEIGVLTPHQVRMLGAAGPGGSVTTSQITWLNTGAWDALVSDPNQVAAITPDETKTLGWPLFPVKALMHDITAMGSNIQYLPDASLAVFTVYSSTSNVQLTGAGIQNISAAQVAVLSPAQVGIIAGTITPLGAGTAIGYLNAGAFAALSDTQIQVLTPTNVSRISAAELASLSLAAFSALSNLQVAVFTSAMMVDVTPEQLASLSTTTLGGLTPITSASLTSTQTSLLSSAQHTACSC